jgi:hypothetical protein
MAFIHSPKIVTDSLMLYLDAGNTKSYPGSGTVWNDLSGNGYNFTINASALSTTNGIAHMNFEGSYGSAKRVVGGSLTDVPNATNGTFMVYTTILNSTATWRTLTRGATNDHQTIIETGTNKLGMYDNDANLFYDAGFDITSLPNPYTQFNCLIWKLSQSSPYYSFQYNDVTTTYTLTNANTTFNNGFCVIGALHAGSTAVGTNSQYWGKVALFLYYNRHLTNQEILQNFNATRSRFGV